MKLMPRLKADALTSSLASLLLESSIFLPSNTSSAHHVLPSSLLFTLATRLRLTFGLMINTMNRKSVKSYISIIEKISNISTLFI